MHLNHLNLCVGDLAEAGAFFERFFDFQTVQRRGNALLVMTDGGGFTLVLSDTQKFGGTPPRYPEGFHLGFILDGPERVDQARSRLVEGGIEVAAPRNLHGSYTCYFMALGGVLFEVSCPV